MDDDKLNISGFSSINPTFPKNDIFADYIIYNPENGNGTLDLSIGKDLHDELQIEPNFDCSYFDNENGKKEINQNGISNKSIFKQIPQKEIQKQILNVNNTPKIKEIKPQDYIVYENENKQKNYLKLIMKMKKKCKNKKSY